MMDIRPPLGPVCDTVIASVVSYSAELFVVGRGPRRPDLMGDRIEPA